MYSFFNTFIFFVFGFIISHFWNYLTVYVLKIYKHAYIKGFHFHHSLFGVLSLFLAGYFFHNQDFSRGINLISFGVGIIVEHTTSVCGFTFLTKD